MVATDRKEQDVFENEVRRVARQLWPDAQYDGAHVVDGLERDGVFETEDCIHLLEATVTRSHMRCDWREGADDEKVLMLHEVQSDWMQDVRRTVQDFGNDAGVGDDAP